MDFIEGVGESSSPPRTFSGFSNYDIRNDVYNRLIESGNDQAVSNPEFRELLDAHFNRLPSRYQNLIAANILIYSSRSKFTIFVKLCLDLSFLAPCLRMHLYKPLLVEEIL